MKSILPNIVSAVSSKIYTPSTLCLTLVLKLYSSKIVSAVSFELVVVIKFLFIFCMFSVNGKPANFSLKHLSFISLVTASILYF